MTPLPVGALVHYHGSHGHGLYEITEHEVPRDGVPDPEINYPDGVAYMIWLAGVTHKFGNRGYSVHQVRRGSLTPIGQGYLAARMAVDEVFG